MADQTPLLGLPFLLPSQAQKHVTHNEALILLDAVVQLAVLASGLNAPPTTPAVGDRYLVGPAPTSAWEGHANAVALLTENGWIFATPRPGWQARDLSTADLLVFDGAQWAAPAQSFENLAGLGINGSSDATNRLAVFSPATLLSHDGAGHHLKINKALASDTASLLFQTSWSGRAEMGTTGSDAFAIKVSADGAAWTTALSFAAATGFASGAAVQQSKTDVTAGRLMRADYGYGPGNVLGPVAQSAGIPNGAVLEAGSNANGRYLRLADGTQICHTTLALGSITAAGAGSFASPYRSAETSWTFPIAFSETPVVTVRALPPAGATLLQRLCAAGAGDTTASSVVGVHVVRIGSDSTANLFSAALLAIGRWF